jgi:hypothetical protein
MLTDKEKNYCSEIASRVSRMRTFLDENDLADPPEATAWHAFLSQLCGIQGNISNDGSFIATLLAKRYLQSKFPVDFDAADKPQGAQGIDIDIRTSEGQHIVAEIKTTVPYKASDFGSNQADQFKKDFAKLTAAKADYKFLFVTDSRAFTFLQKDKYRKLMPAVRVVHLGTGQEYFA